MNAHQHLKKNMKALTLGVFLLAISLRSALGENLPDSKTPPSGILEWVGYFVISAWQASAHLDGRVAFVGGFLTLWTVWRFAETIKNLIMKTALISLFAVGGGAAAMFVWW